MRIARHIVRFGVLAGVLAGVAAAVGCGDILSEDFLTALGLRPGATNLPGEAPAIVLGVENGTSRVVQFQISWRDSENAVQSRQTPLVPAGEDMLFSEFCPIQEVTLGDVSDLSAFGAIVRLGDGNADDAFVEVEPFGILLQEGINYQCGDRIVFSVAASNETRSGYRTFVRVEHSGAQLPDPNQ